MTNVYTSLHALSIEEKQLLSKCRPGTLGAAKRIQGITPVAVLELIRYTRKAQSRSWAPKT
jgi:tRNA uridine 5-carboxymethylaminomethyl modification enzyme